MRSRLAEKILPMPEQPKSYCECGKPIYDGRRKRCEACTAAVKKAKSKRPSTVAKYAQKEVIIASINELEQAIQMQEWLLLESKKKLTSLKALLFKI